MKKYAVWQSRPVFVTSTFRDMQAERDYLHAHVFPALAERLRERYHHLEPIDLRWGVELTGAGGQEAKELLVLKVCLDEIRRSRPFLIGLIGDRYGWTPPPARMRAAAQEAGYGGTLEGRSVTALEIEFGVLESPGQKRRSRFYLREPLPYATMGAAAADYSDLHSGEAGAAGAHQRLEALKRRLAAELPGRVRPYRAEWDATHGVTGLEAWGRMVLEDLWADLEEETREYVHAAPATWQQEESWVLEQFAATQCPDFIGREEFVGAALRFAAAPGGAPWALAVTGEPGSGKSSWFGRVWGLLRERGDCLTLAHAAGVSARSGSVDAMLRRWIGELAEHLGDADPAEALQGREQVEKAFAELLSRAAARGRVVCLIDALNQFERTPVARRMAWLPELWPANARLIATAIPGEESEALLKRPGAQRVELPVLDGREAAAIVKSVCGRHHKALPQEALRELLSKKLPEGRAAAGNPLWLQLGLEELLLLDAGDFERAEQEFAGPAEARLAAMLADVARSFPPGVPSLYATLLERAERAYGAAWTRAFAELLALSRTGWRESDLEALLPLASGEPWDPLRFAALRRGFRTHLVQRGASAQWDFSHAQMRAAAERRYLGRPETRRARHALLAEHLAALPSGDPLRDGERMFHLIGADDRAGAASHYGDPGLSAGEKSGATRALAAHVASQGEAAVEWVASLVEASPENERLRWLSVRYLFDLQDALADLADLRVRLRIAEAARKGIEELRRRTPDSADYARDLEISYERLGDLHRGLGEPQRALEFYQNALAIAEGLRRRAPDSADYARDLGVSYDRLGDLHGGLGEPQRALEFYQKSLSLREELRRRAPDSADYARDLSVSYNKLGDLHRGLGEPQRALEFYQNALAIAEELRRRVPDSADYARDLGTSYERLGDLHLGLGEPQRALEFYQKDLAIAEELRRRAPDSADYARDLSVSYNKLGDLHRGLGELQRALEFYQKDLAIAEELRRRAPDSADYARDLGISYERLGELHLGLGEPQRALEFYQKSLSLREELRRRAPDSAVYARDLAVSCYKLRDFHAQNGDGAQATDFARRFLTVVGEMRHAGMFVDEALDQACQQVQQEFGS